VTIVPVRLRLGDTMKIGASKFPRPATESGAVFILPISQTRVSDLCPYPERIC
jgi:hypothetical protein